METDGVELDEQHLPGRQGRLLFAYLTTAGGRPVPRDELADVLWGDAVPATWEKALGVLASKLRAVLSEAMVDGTATLTAAFGCYRLELPEGTWIDVLEAAAAAREAESLLAADEPEGAQEAAALAESVARLPFLPGDDGPWVQAKRRELDDVRMRGLTVLAEASLLRGKPTDAIPWAEQAIESQPFRESSYRLLMAAQIAAGNRAEALRVYERCRRLLADELGSYPSPETESVYRDLLEVPSSMDTAPADPRQPPLPERPSPMNRRRRLVLAFAVLVGAGAAALVLALDSSGGRAVQPDSVVRIDPNTLRVTEVARVGDAPDLIVAAGGYLWVTNWVLRDSPLGKGRNAGDLGLWRVDPATGQAEVVGGGVSPCGIARDPSGNVWVANCFAPALHQSSNVRLIDAGTMKFKKTILVPGGDNYFRGIAFGGGFLWVGRSPGPTARVDEVREVDPRFDGRVVSTVRIAHPPGAMGWSGHYGDLWTTGFHDHTLTRYHAATGEVKTINLEEAVNPDWVAFDDRAVWVGDWSKPALVRIDATGPPRPRSIPLPVLNRRRCRNLSCIWTVAAGEGAIWATTPRDRALWRIDPKTDHATRISLPYEPAGVTVSGGEVWVTVRGH